ncbi:MAG: cell envelope integrity protein TolA [Burkholderiales bacterium]
MTAYAHETRNEKAISGALALVMHMMFFALLVFGVTWQKRETPPMVAELWSSLPAPKAAPPPPSVEPKPVPKAEPKPLPKVEPKPAPKPDIALRDKKEKALKAKERELAEKKKREEQARLEALKQQQAQEAEAKRAAQEQAEALKKLAQQQAAAQASEVDKYKQLIADHIRRRIFEPPGLQGNPQVELDVTVLPGGDVLEVRTRKASGQPSWDAAVERAVRGASPLPLPQDPTLHSRFRELDLRFRPKE